MEKKLRRFTIVTDKSMRGLGYSRLRDESQYIHTLVLFVFIILWSRPVRTGRIQSAKWYNTNCVRMGYKVYDFKYYGDVDNLKCIYYRGHDGLFREAKQFQQLKDGSYVIKLDITNIWIAKAEADVYVFNPEKRIEGYIKGNTFYGVREDISFG